MFWFAHFLPIVLLLAALVSPALAQPITVRHPTSQSTSAAENPAADPFSFARVILALGAVVLLILVFKWGARRFVIGGSASGHSRAIQVISRTVVSPRQQFLLVKVGRRLVLVANTGSGMNPICEIRDEQEVTELLGQVSSERVDSVTRAFGSLFRREEEKFSSPEENPEPSDSEELEKTAESEEMGKTRNELSGLMEKVRLLSKQFKRS